MNYFIITGLDNGIPIEPYGVEMEASFPHEISVSIYDYVRYYEPITEKEYNKLIQKEGKM